MRVMNLAVLNVKTQPHSKDGYVDLFKSAHRMATPAKIRGADWGMFGTLYSESHETEGQIIYGDVYKFLNIDPRGEWLDLQSLRPIEAIDENAVPPVPDHLKPNLKKIPYVLFPRKHRFFFSIKHMAPASMRSLLNNLFLQDDITERFGQIDISVQSTQEALQSILAIPRLTKLNISFTIPNDDEIGSDIEEKVLRRIHSQNIRSLDQQLTSTEEKGIEADEETKALMNIACSNGTVTGTGYEEETRIVKSTEDHPLTTKRHYNPDSESQLHAMLQASLSLLAKI
jgi:hypothetical protein